MSNFSTAHTVTPFDAKKSQALTGQRLAKVGYKSSKTQAAKFPSVCASIPMIPSESILAAIDSLVPHVRTMLEGTQDAILRSLYETSGGLLGQVVDSEISIDACVKFLEAESTGGRLTGEFLKAWYVDAGVADVVTVLVAEKLKWDAETLSVEQQVVIEKHSNAYRDIFASLAGGKTMLQPAQIKSLLNVLALVDTDSTDTVTKLNERLNKMLVAPKIEELLEL